MVSDTNSVDGHVDNNDSNNGNACNNNYSVRAADSSGSWLALAEVADAAGGDAEITWRFRRLLKDCRIVSSFGLTMLVPNCLYMPEATNSDDYGIFSVGRGLRRMFPLTGTTPV